MRISDQVAREAILLHLLLSSRKRSHQNMARVLILALEMSLTRLGVGKISFQEPVWHVPDIIIITTHVTVLPRLVINHFSSTFVELLKTFVHFKMFKFVSHLKKN